MVLRSKVFYLIFAMLVAAFMLTGCGTSAENGQTGEDTAKESGEKTDYASSVKEKPIVTITMQNDEKIVLELDPAGNGTGGLEYSIEGEFSTNGFENNMKHERGVISMARTNDPNSAGSQFFIMVKEAPHLDGEYAAFGKVIEGMETVDAIVSVERDRADKPVEDQQMKKVEVDTKGFDYPEPEVQ